MPRPSPKRRLSFELHAIAVFAATVMLLLGMAGSTAIAKKKAKPAPKTTSFNVGTDLKERDEWIKKELEDAKGKGAKPDQLKELEKYLGESYRPMKNGGDLSSLDRRLHEICPCLFIRVIEGSKAAKSSNYTKGSIIVRRPDNLEGVDKSIQTSKYEKDLKKKNDDFCDCYKVHRAGCNLVWSLARSPKPTRIWIGKSADNPGQSGRKGENRHRKGNISWNPQDTKSDPSTTGENKRPRSVGLAHELAHAVHQSKGTKRQDRSEELNAGAAENQVRAEMQAAAQRQLDGEKTFHEFKNPKRVRRRTFPRKDYRFKEKDKDGKETVISLPIPDKKDIDESDIIKKAKKVALVLPQTPFFGGDQPEEGYRVAVQDEEVCVATTYTITDTPYSGAPLLSVALDPAPAIHFGTPEQPASAPPEDSIPVCTPVTSAPPEKPEQPEQPAETPSDEPVITSQTPPVEEVPEETPDLGLVKASETVVTIALSGDDDSESIEGTTIKFLADVPDLPAADETTAAGEATDAYQSGVAALETNSHGEVTVGFADQAAATDEDDGIELLEVSDADGQISSSAIVTPKIENRLPKVKPSPQLVVASKSPQQSLPASLTPAGAQVCVKRAFPIGDTNVFVVSLPADAIEPFIENAEASDEITFIEPDPCRNKEEITDPHFKGAGLWGQKFDNQWAIKRTGLDGADPAVWPGDTAGLQPVTVAIIDTGLDWQHPDLPSGALWRNPGEVPGNGIDDDHNGYVDDIIGWDFVVGGGKPWDHDGHGTFVTGIIAAGHNETGIAGINPAARIMVLRALDPFGRGHASMVAHAISYAADNGARIINLSLGGRTLTSIEQLAADYAHTKGALLVVAAGNAAKAVKDYSPGGLKGVITVAATDRRDRWAGFSNWGPLVDIGAPGVDVLSLRARSTDLLSYIPGVKYQLGQGIVGDSRAYYRASGTSFAAPIVAGALSLILSRNPQLDHQAARRMVLNSASDIDIPGIDNYTGFGLLDIKAALEASPEYFLLARISGAKVIQKSGKAAVRILGTTDADAFKSAVVMLGKGAEPKKWFRVNRTIKKPVTNGTLIELPARFFKGAAQWTIRLITHHNNGSKRETRFKLKLG